MQKINIPRRRRMVNLKIDGKNVVVPEGTTILDAAKQAGIDIPTLVLLIHPRQRVEDDTDGIYIVDVFKTDAFAFHLVPDGIGGFHTGTHFIVEPHLLQLPVHRHGKMLEQSVTGCFRRFQFQIDKGIFLRMLILKAQVFQLCLDGEKPQTVC